MKYGTESELRDRRAAVSPRTIENDRVPLRMLKDMYGRTPADDFDARSLKVLRQAMIDAGWSRRHVNDRVVMIRSMFRWGVSEGIVRPDTLTSLTAVKGLKAGRSAARETKPVPPVADDVVARTIARLGETVAAMVMVQSLTGARPGEVCSMRLEDIDRTGDLWVYSPRDHKTAHRGRVRRIVIGPRAQAIIAEAAGTRIAGPVFTTPGGKPYRTLSYARAIARAAARAGLPHWTPNQLRHAAATRVRAIAGLETARAMLGHATASITEQWYAEIDMQKVAEVVRKHG